jgi:hypothetical protein
MEDHSKKVFGGKFRSWNARKWVDIGRGIGNDKETKKELKMERH